MVIDPPSGIASRAFMAKFSSAFSSRDGSTEIHISVSVHSKSNSVLSPSVLDRKRTNFSIVSLTFLTSGASVVDLQ